MPFTIEDEVLVAYLGSDEVVTVPAGVYGTAGTSSACSKDTRNLRTSTSQTSTTDKKSLAYLFKGCAKLRCIDLSRLDTSAVEDMRQMFFGCRSLREVDLSCLDTSQVRTMAHLFHNCHALRRVSLHGLNLARVTSLWSAFDCCESLEDLDLTVSAMPPVEKTKHLFRGCTSIRRWTVAEAWPVRYDTIPAPSSECGMWWSTREQAWMTVGQIVERGPASDVFTSVPAEFSDVV